MEDGTYELTYVAPVEGVYELAVKMFGSHIAGSPFKISATAAPPPDNEKINSFRKASAPPSRYTCQSSCLFFESLCTG